MSKARDWDRVHRKERAKKPEYIEELRSAPRPTLRPTPTERVVQRVKLAQRQRLEADMQHLGVLIQRRAVVSSALETWLTANNICNVRLHVAIASRFGQLVKQRQLIHDATDIVAEFCRFNAQVENIAAEFGSFQIQPPKKLQAWLLKFRTQL